MDFANENGLIFDPIHGYISFVSGENLPAGEASERELLDHAWLQRLRQIHQLQTAWWVFPTAEHTRFQHVVGVMHLAGRVAAQLYDGLQKACKDAPSRDYIVILMRLAGLLHDVGHGPFGHFLDEHFLRRHGLTHETLGREIILRELGPLLRKIRQHPAGRVSHAEEIDPEQIAYLIQRPQGSESIDAPRWLRLLRSLFCGIYTVDNMDFVLRDGYMTGYSSRAFDLDRLLYYSFFSEAGLTIHAKGLDSLLRFLTVRAELFRSVYFHRTVRAIDLALADLFAASREWLFPGNPLEHLDEYRQFTEWSLLVDVARWAEDSDQSKQKLGVRWNSLLAREVPWEMVCQRSIVFGEQDAERASVFQNAELLDQAVRAQMPEGLANLPLRFDVARHVYRPHTSGPAAGQNFLFDPSSSVIRPLRDDQLFRRLPVSQRLCRVYAEDLSHAGQIAAAVDSLIGPGGADDLTNM